MDNGLVSPVSIIVVTILAIVWCSVLVQIILFPVIFHF